MTAADTNVLLRVLLNDEPAHARRALDWLVAQPGSSVLVMDAVLTELTFILQSKRLYGLTRSEFMPPLMELLSGPVWCLSALTWRALSLFESTRLDYVDCLLAAMHEAGEVRSVATFDQGLVRQVGDAAV